MTDILFKTIEDLQKLSNSSWGEFLDAGTGVHSLIWLQQLNTTSWTAITADTNMLRQIENDKRIIRRTNDRIVVGNWMDNKFCENIGMYDTILADYLIGAVDGFSPYYQDVIIQKLKCHLKPNGKLYFVGMNPIPDHPHYPGNIVSEVRRLRDSCILLAGHKPYREFPLDWMTRHITNNNNSNTNSTTTDSTTNTTANADSSPNVVITCTKTFTILHSEDSINRQIRVAQSKLDLFPNDLLRDGMKAYIEDLRRRVSIAVRESSNGKIPLSFDYIIAATRICDADNNSHSKSDIDVSDNSESNILVDSEANECKNSLTATSSNEDVGITNSNA